MCNVYSATIKELKPVLEQVWLKRTEVPELSQVPVFLILCGVLCFTIPCLEFCILSYFPISSRPTPFEDTAKPSLCLRGGATPRMINRLARADGREACFIHEGFHLHASETLASLMVPAGC